MNNSIVIIKHQKAKQNLDSPQPKWLVTAACEEILDFLERKSSLSGEAKRGADCRREKETLKWDRERPIEASLRHWLDWVLAGSAFSRLGPIGKSWKRLVEWWQADLIGPQPPRLQDTSLYSIEACKRD